MPLVQIVNRCTVVPDDVLAKYTVALQRQISNDLNIPWVVRPVRLEFVPTNVDATPEAWHLLVVDDPNVPGALGYHDWTPNGQPVGYVFARLDIEDGLSVSVTMSHELIEMLGDPWINCCVQEGKRFWARELCDPVEADQDGYLIDVDVHLQPIEPVLVSNFVLPAWYVNGSAGPWDFRSLLHGPLALRAGGYASYVDAHGSGHWNQIESSMAQRHKTLRKGSRRERRERFTA